MIPPDSQSAFLLPNFSTNNSVAIETDAPWIISSLCHDEYGWSILHPSSALNPCFIDSAILLFPSLILFVFGWFKTYSHKDSKHAYKPWFYYSKIVLAIFAIVLNFSVALLSYLDSRYDIRFVAPIVTGLCLGLALNIHVKEDILGVPSGTLLIYWLFSTVTYAVKIVYLANNSNTYFNKDYPTLLAYSIIYIFLIVISTIVFFLEYLPFNYFNIPKSYQLPEDLRESTPIFDNADIFSRFAFTWMNPIIVKATEGEITPNDLPIVESNFKSSVLAVKFLKYWNARRRDHVNQLIMSIVKAFGYLIALGGLIEFTIDGLDVIQPFLLRYLLIFAQSYYTDDPQPVPLGFYISFGMFAVAMFRTYCRTSTFLTTIHLMLSVRGSLSSVIYKKSLRVSGKARQEQSTGEIVNLLSTDVNTIVQICIMISSVWQAPIKLVMCLAGLYHLLGISAFVGPFVILASLPINSFLTSRLRKMRLTQMKLKDSRIKQTTEILTNMKSLKLYGWEPPLIEKLKSIRGKQLGSLKKLIILSSFLDFMWMLVPVIITTATFGTFVYLEEEALTPDIVFPSLSLFLLMNDPIITFPRTLVVIINSYVSFERVCRFLTAEEISTEGYNRDENSTVSFGDVSVKVEKSSFGWSSNINDGLALKEIDYEVRKGELSSIVGKVGSGKTSFLKAILGELFSHQGLTTTHGHIAYVSQDMWLMNASLRENILFGHRYDETFYNLTIEACALNPDIALLPDGDQTEIGEMGISLSGGQKARVSLARAVYARADIYLLDDPLSAVDEHVASHVMDKVLCAKGLLGTKSRILATNSIHALRYSDSIVMLQNGQITQRATYSEVVSSQSDSPLKQLIDEFGRQHNDAPRSSTPVDSSSNSKPKFDTDSITEGESSNDEVVLLEETDVSVDGEGYLLNKKEPLAKRRQSFRRASLESLTDSFRNRKPKPASKTSILDPITSSNQGSGSNTPNTTASQTTAIDPSQVEVGKAQSLVKRTEKVAEKAQQGHVKFAVYVNYVRACGIGAFIFMVSVVILSTLNTVTTKFWLKRWSEHNSDTGDNSDASYYLSVYLAIGIFFSIFVVARKATARMLCGLNASKKLHNEMLLAVTRSPMQFFETTPTGRIINRFSADVTDMDESLPNDVLDMISVITDLFVSVAVIVYGAPMVIIILLPLIAVYSYYQRYYASASRALKRLLVISRSPIFSHFQETLTGSTTIRAFGQIERFEHINSVNIDYNMRAIFLFRGVNRWLSMRQQVIGSFFTFTSAIFVTYGAIHKSISPGLIGIVMGYSAVLSEGISYFIKVLVSLETSIIAVERILEYCDLPSEAEDIITDHRPKREWPEQGSVTFQNYSTRYRENLDLVLKDINLEIKPMQKIGVAGRTGVGKSSLIMALFRIIEPASGTIVIDGTDTTQIGLRDLRTHLSIIPQDSQIFGGSIRQNLDPLNVYSDEKIWEVLDLAHLSNFVESLPNSINTELAEGGSNISAGQKQLICLGRALLHDSAILVLDEATASVDIETDKLIQDTIRTSFKHKTIITIAHRLNTIMDSDRILVLDKGQVAEYDSPQALLANPSSLFYALCKRGGMV